MQNSSIDFRELVDAKDMRGDDEVDTELLHRALFEARQYLASQRWCARILREYFGMGVGGIFAVFLFQVDNEAANDDDWIWVVVGDLPSAYLVPDQAPNPSEALRVYVSLMTDWIEAVEQHGDLDAVFPVAAEPTAANARLLRVRLDYLRQEFLRPPIG